MMSEFRNLNSDDQLWKRKRKETEELEKEELELKELESEDVKL